VTQLAKIEPTAPLTESPAADAGQLLSALIARGESIPNAVGLAEQLINLKVKTDALNAKKEWIGAFSRVRAKLRTINAVKGIPDRSGAVRWHYAPLEDLQDAVEPILHGENLFLRFDSRREGDLCIGVCIMSHTSGHEERAECAINTKGCEGGDLGALKKAKRGALTAMLGIKTRHDADARDLGGTIDRERIDDLRERIKATGSDERRMLKLAGVERFEDIREAAYTVLDNFIAGKERASKPKHPSDDGQFVGEQ
jgi:hypothetical protein